jgi:hypothetical protein
MGARYPDTDIIIVLLGSRLHLIDSSLCKRPVPVEAGSGVTSRSFRQ